eukprot:gnl/Spiro4/27247_TR13549_c0_g1_i1.p1 gnl/Spiro4/27247_TR13549_c0_g1~~gnl/Spiro4/27247_TR13549_c0_g1_i1.p1  ORF type:complete len:733 (-),score=230.39 gnl/Spiro4/27247_TR13549_c0_g1_i1:23-2191(-)
MGPFLRLTLFLIVCLTFVATTTARYVGGKENDPTLQLPEVLRKPNDAQPAEEKKTAPERDKGAASPDPHQQHKSKGEGEAESAKAPKSKKHEAEGEASQKKDDGKNNKPSKKHSENGAVADDTSAKDKKEPAKNSSNAPNNKKQKQHEKSSSSHGAEGEEAAAHDNGEHDSSHSGEGASHDSSHSSNGASHDSGEGGSHDDTQHASPSPSHHGKNGGHGHGESSDGNDAHGSKCGEGHDGGGHEKMKGDKIPIVQTFGRETETQRHDREEQHRERELSVDTAYEDEDEQNSLETTIYEAGLIILGLILFSLTVEVATHHLEHHLEKKNMLQLLQKLYKEIMIVGLCGILLFLEEKFSFYATFFPNGFNKHLFEEVHFALFFSFLFYIVCVLTLMYFTVGLTYLWARVEGPVDNPTQLAEHRDKISTTWKELEVQGEAMSKVRFFFDIPFKMQYYTSRDQYEYHVCRDRFLTDQKLPADFHFHTYLKHATRQVCIQMAGIHWSVWLIVFVGVFLNTLRTRLVDVDAWHGALMFFVLEYGVLAFAVLLAAKCRRIVEDLLVVIESHVDDHVSTHAVHQEDGNSHHAAESAGSGLSEDEMDPTAYFKKGESRQHALFWFGNPNFILISIQFVVLLQAILVSMYIGFLSRNSLYLYFNEFVWVHRLLLHALAITPFVIVNFFLLPWLMPNFIFSRSIGHIINWKALKTSRRSWEKQKKKLTSAHSH